MLNEAILMGRVTRDMELRDAGSRKVVNNTLAVQRDFRPEGKPDTDFHDFAVFGKSAEVMADKVAKGAMIVIKGRLEKDNYTDKDGKTRSNTKIIVDNWYFAEGKRDAQAEPAADESDEIPFA